MSNSPSYASAPLATARQPLSGSALTSFILGLLLCVPLLTGLAAILFAVVGFKATRNSARRGRGFAITGLILGIVGILIWSGIGASVLFVVRASEAPRASLHTFARNVFTENLPAAADCDSSITTDQLETVHAYVVPFGAYSDLTCTGINLSTTPLAPPANSPAPPTSPPPPTP